MTKEYAFNPPPSWPTPPRGWQPPEGWGPDPSWGPAPEDWNFWVPVEPSWLSRNMVLVGGLAGVALLGFAALLVAVLSNQTDATEQAKSTSPPSASVVQPLTAGGSTPEGFFTGSSSTQEQPSETATTSPTLPVTTITQSPTSKGKLYANCREVRIRYPRGVGLPTAREIPRPGQPRNTAFARNKNVYETNSGLDFDSDGVICEG